LAFATSDAHAALTSPFKELSVEFLFYNAVQQMAAKNPHEGISIKAIGHALSDTGQPLERDWPYIECLPTDIAEWHPPANCPVLKHLLSPSVSPFDGIINLLTQDCPVIIVLKLSLGFHSPDMDGVVSDTEKLTFTGLHAVVGVGYGTINGTPSLLVRNSWGATWGVNGHALLSKAYVDNRATEISTIS